MTTQQQYKLLNKQTAAVSLSKGFDLSSLTNQGIDSLFASYDQVQVKNGQQSVLLQRATGNNANIAPQADINAAGQLQVLPDVGQAQTNYQLAQRAAATTSATQAAAATPTWEKYAIPLGIGAVAIGALILLIRHG